MSAATRQLFMIGKAWINVLFGLWENYKDIIRTKDRAIDRVVSYEYQRCKGMDCMHSCDELIDKLVEKQAIVTIVRDVKKAYADLPKKAQKIIAMKHGAKKLFYQVAQELGCSLRCALYHYKNAISKLGANLEQRGYSDIVLAEIFEGDKLVEHMLVEELENAQAM